MFRWFIFGCLMLTSACTVLVSKSHTDLEETPRRILIGMLCTIDAVLLIYLILILIFKKVR